MSDRASSEKSMRSRSRSKSRNGDVLRSRSKDISPVRDRSASRSRSRSYRKKYRSRSPSYSRRRSRHSRSHSRSYSRSRSHSGGGYRSRSGGRPRPNRCLGVFGLSIYTTERQIRDIFQKYGVLDKVQIIFDAKTGRSRGFCFVYYESEDDARIAKEECSGMDIDGRRIRVDYSVTQRAHTPTPGIYMGNPTFTRNDRHYDRRRNYDDDYYSRGGRSSYRRRSPSPYRSSYRRRYDHSRSRSYSPRR